MHRGQMQRRTVHAARSQWWRWQVTSNPSRLRSLTAPGFTSATAMCTWHHVTLASCLHQTNSANQHPHNPGGSKLHPHSARLPNLNQLLPQSRPWPRPSAQTQHTPWRLGTATSTTPRTPSRRPSMAACSPAASAFLPRPSATPWPSKTSAPGPSSPVAVRRLSHLVCRALSAMAEERTNG